MQHLSYFAQFYFSAYTFINVICNCFPGEIVPGRVWTAKLGGGLPRKFHWVERTRLTAEEVQNEVMYQEKVSNCN